MKKYFTSFIILSLTLFTKNGNCQVILNGDFEINNVSSCLINPTNSVFNASINHAWSIGNNTSSGVDLQNISCGYAIPPSNLWFASLAKNLIIGTPFWGNDELSLELDDNLVAGEIYQISYYDYSSSSFGSLLIPLEIGLSMDSTSFGDSIYGSFPSIDLWTLKTFTFTAPNNGKYLTVRNEDKGTIRGWNFIDNFHFSNLTANSELKNTTTLVLYPNPFKSIVTIKVNENEQSEFILYDVLLRKRIKQIFTNTTTINTDKLENGIYFYEVRNSNEIVKSGKVIKE
jgi:hypothetical protein